MEAARIPTFERMQIQAALGRECLRIADELHCHLETKGSAPRHLWRALLQELQNSAGDALQSPAGRTIQLGIIARLQGDNGDTADLPSPYGDFYIPSGCIPDVLRGTVRHMRDGCYSFADILDLASHHLVWIGEAQAVEERLRGGAVTVRAFLRERYGVMAAKSECGDRSDLRRFRLWLADARWRVRKVRREQRRRVTAWKAETMGRVM